jgi:hypothetical protein
VQELLDRVELHVRVLVEVLVQSRSASLLRPNDEEARQARAQLVDRCGRQLVVATGGGVVRRCDGHGGGGEVLCSEGGRMW